jgi:catechol 2,3-dioxygenase-like lactoylglutathione lyase family enzyme
VSAAAVAIGADTTQQAHAVLHCNLNTANPDAMEAFYTGVFGLRIRMRSVDADGDATPMGLGSSTASETRFLYDRRGPRAAPALELVHWHRPATAPRPGLSAEATRTGVETGFAALGLRVASLDTVAARLAAGGRDARTAQLTVRGTPRPALRTVDPDGVTVEVVEIPPAANHPDAGLLSHERLRCRDLARSAEWYTAIGFAARVDSGTASLVLPEDPTFSLELDEHADAVRANHPANTLGLYRVALAVDDVRAARTALAAVRTDVPEPVFIPMPDVPTGGFTVLFLTDPDGAVVELVERPRSAVRRPAEPH